ncbi:MULTISPECIES: hypothetical protein [unclassified Nonomuraea]|uniref:hypothetical protein n=1 Tax=unclassified Nonomuraea TaxID=2593643 RepID=UPI003404AAE0
MKATTMLDVFRRMDAMAISALEAHWLLGRLAAENPRMMAEALDALERRRDAA